MYVNVFFCHQMFVQRSNFTSGQRISIYKNYYYWFLQQITLQDSLNLQSIYMYIYSKTEAYTQVQTVAYTLGQTVVQHTQGQTVVQTGKDCSIHTGVNCSIDRYRLQHTQVCTVVYTYAIYIYHVVTVSVCLHLVNSIVTGGWAQ